MQNPSPDQLPTTVSEIRPVVFECCECGHRDYSDNPFCEERTRYGLCEACADKRAEARFNTICPPLYLGTDTARLPQDEFQQAMKWNYGSMGLILVGETGKSKTRIAWQVIKKTLLSRRGKFEFYFFDCISFGHEIARHYRDEDCEDWLDSVARAALVFFDDLGKLKLTDRAEAELFGVIERRCSLKLPIIATTNDTGETLCSRMTDNRGAALVRRLREFCEVIKF